MNYLDFEVEIGPGLGGEYPVQILRSPAGEARATMHLPFDAKSLETRLAAVQAALLRSSPVRRGAASAAAEKGPSPQPSVDVQQLGQELFGSLFDASMQSLLVSSQDKAEKEQRGLRIKLRIEAPELAMLPWEFLYDPGRSDYLSLAASRPLVRYVPLKAPSEALAIARPLRILGVIASPAGLKPLNVERERQRLELAVDALRGRGDVELVWLGGQSARYLQAALRDGPWHVLHFIGHGGFDREAGHGFLVLANDEGGPKLLYADDLSHLVNDHRDLRLVVLNACDGARGNEVDLFSSSASFLVRQGTPAVVAMQFEITDEAAIEFSRSFYEALADGAPIDTALGEARKSMSIAHQGSLEWGTPVLYTHAADGRLFKVKRAGRRASVRPMPVAAGGKVTVVFDAVDTEAVAALVRLLERSGNIATTLIPIGAGSTASSGAMTALETAPGSVLVAGPAGPTVLEHPTIRRILARRSHDEAFRIAPLLLPGSSLPDLGRMPEFLAGREWLDLRGGVADPDRIEELVAVLAGPESTLAPARGGAQSKGPPFRGLQVFEEEDADNFFGREALTQQLVEHLRGDRFLAVVGPSGSGKSSVVRAGLVPSLRHGLIPGSEAWPIVVLKPGAHPLDTLAAKLAPVVGSEANAIATRDAILTALLHDVRGLHTTVETALARKPEGQRLLVVVDQFEEAFTLCRDEAERERFISLLLEAASEVGGQTIVLLTMRADFMGRTSAFPALAAGLAQHIVLVTPMTREELRRAIVLPARRAGLQFEAGVVDTILAELGGEAGALPLLEDTLLELWQGRSGGWLTMEQYRRIGGVRGALEQRADELYDSLPENQQLIARQVLLGLVELGTGAEVTRRRARLSGFTWSRPGMEPPEVSAVIQKLVDARLITTGSDETGEIVDVAHEALINNWATFKGWIDVYGTGLRLHRTLAEEARRWQEGGRDPSDLRRGRRLSEAVAWSHETLDDIADVAPFLDASSAAEQAAEQARLEAEAEKQRVRRRQLRTVIGLGAAIIVVLAVGAGAALWSARQAEDARASEVLARTAAEQARVEAQHAQLVAEAQAKSAQGVASAVTKPLPGLADALQGWALAGQAGIGTSDYRRAVEDLLVSGRIAAIGDGVERLVPSLDRRFVVVDRVGAPGAIVRLADGAQVATLAGEVYKVVVGPPNAGVFGIEYLDAPGELRQWATGAGIPLGNDIPDFHFPLDTTGEVVIVGYQGRTVDPTDPAPLEPVSPVEIRSIADGALIRRLAGPAGSIAVLQSTKGARALIALGDHIEIIRMTDGTTVRSIDAVGYRLPSGGPPTIFAGGSSSSVGVASSCSIYRTSDGAVISAVPRWAEREGFIDGCGVVSVSPDGRMAAVSMRHRVALIDVADIDARPVWTTTDEILHVAIPPGSEPTRVLAFSTGGVAVWRIGDAVPLATHLGRPANVEFGSPPVQFSPDGAYAAFKLDRALVIMRISDGELMTSPEGSVNPEEQFQVERVDFAVGANGTVAHVVYASGREFTFLPEKPLQHVVEGRVAFWPGANGPDVAENWDPAFGRPSAPMPSFSDVLFGPSLDPVLAVVRFERDQAALSVGSVQPAIVLFRDGTTVALRTSVDAVDFARDDTASTLIVRYSDERSEAWDTAQRRAIGILGLGVGSNIFDATGQHLAVRYLSGDAYLVDVERLRQLPADLNSLSDPELQALVCTTLGSSAASLAPAACS